MKRNVWIAGIMVVLLLSGCSIREYQIKRAGEWARQIFPGALSEKETDTSDEQEDTAQEETEISREDNEDVPDKLSEKELSGGDRLAQGNEETLENGEAASSKASGAESEAAGNRSVTLGSTEEIKETISYQTKYIVNCKKSITLRETPSTKAAQIGEILLGEPVSFIKDDVDGFSKIVYQGKTGYVLAAYLGDAAPTLNDTAYYTMRVVNCKQSISLRRSPSVEATEICQIPLGAIVSYVDSAADGFYEITYLGKTGYALASYLEFYSASENEVDSEEVSNTESVEAVRVSFSYFIQNERECADIVGLTAQNQKAWQYEARSSHGVTELESIQEIGTIGNVYYFNEDGTIVALSLEDGRVLWKNGDFAGASLSYSVDEQGTLYLCGYYGPDLCVIDRNGNTLIYIESFSPDLQWPCEIRYENRAVYVNCTDGVTGQDVVVRYDLATGGIVY